MMTIKTCILSDFNLSYGAVVMYLHLVKKFQEAGGPFVLSNKELAEIIGSGATMARSRKAELVEAGYIKSDIVTIDKKNTCRYTIL